MVFNLKRRFRYYFPHSFEMFIFGSVMLIVSFPGIGMIFFDREGIFPNLMEGLYLIGVTWGCISLFIGLFFIVFGLREVCSPGTVVYRLTHLRVF